jgi:3-dehydroquinate dehydratase type I
MLILSIPYLDPEFIIEQSADNKYTWKEFRLDYQQDLNEFPFEVLNPNSIITIRDISEGGHKAISSGNKLQFYQKAIKESNCLVDYEMLLYKPNSISSNNLILSYHDFNEDTNYNKLEKILQKMNHTEAKFVKIAVNISSYSDLTRISNLINTSNKPVILAGMGKLGKICRLLYKHIAAAGTFIGLGAMPTATGQISVEEVEFYSFHKISNLSQLGGIIGGVQIENSLGLKFYNDFFKQTGHDAFYFPFLIDDIDDFKNWFEHCTFKEKFYGFSVTMPFKKQIKPSNKPINLFLPKSISCQNTDMIAFHKAIDKLEIDNQTRILIYGNGGSAETALEALKKYKNVYVCARIQKNNFSTDREFLAINKAQQMEFDLLINCTPIGMNGEDFRQETGITNFKKVIDLPYQKESTKLIQYCRSNSIPFVDGIQFWQWQVEKQLEEFIKEIVD